MLESIKSSNIVASVDDPFNDYEDAANYRFTSEVIPNIYNEILTYAICPNLEMGEYKIKQPKESNLVL